MKENIINLNYMLKMNYSYNNIYISSSGLNIGTHVPFDRTLTRTVNFAISTGMYGFQFFMGSPQSFVRSNLKENDIKDTLLLKNRYPMFIFTHAPYVYNLAKEDNNDIRKSLEFELKQVSMFGNGVVLHPGSNIDKKKGIKEISSNISKINFSDGSILILENMSGQGNMIGSRLEELRDIRINVIEEKQKHIGFCIDTAHIWGMGLYNLSEEKEIDKMFIDLEHFLGIQNIKLFHVNDSTAKYGSKIDRHQLLGEGEIWGKNKGSSLRYLLRKINDYNIPIVLETDPSDIRKFLY